MKIHFLTAGHSSSTSAAPMLLCSYVHAKLKGPGEGAAAVLNGCTQPSAQVDKQQLVGDGGEQTALVAGPTERTVSKKGCQAEQSMKLLAITKPELRDPALKRSSGRGTRAVCSGVGMAAALGWAAFGWKKMHRRQL